MNRAVRLFLMLAALLAAASAGARTRNVTDVDAPRNLAGDSRVSVAWTDPSEFADLKYSGNRWRAGQGNWVYQLAEHLRDSADKRLPQGERLEVTITDLHRAGRYEPWHGVQMQDVRVLRDIYPPSMSLQFRRLGESGEVVAEGSREIRDTSYLMGSPAAGMGSSHLYYEKRMIDDWLRDELRREQVANR